MRAGSRLSSERGGGFGTTSKSSQLNVTGKYGVAHPNLDLAFGHVCVFCDGEALGCGGVWGMVGVDHCEERCVVLRRRVSSGYGGMRRAGHTALN